MKKQGLIKSAVWFVRYGIRNAICLWRHNPGFSLLFSLCVEWDVARMLIAEYEESNSE